MSRLLFLIVVILVVIAGFMTIRFAKESYKVLPVQSESEALHTNKYETWHEFKSPAGNFKVQVPILPQHATERLTDPKTHNVRDYDMYVSEEQNGTIFMISLITFLDKSSATNAELLLTNIMNDMVAANPKNKLITMQSGTYQGHTSLDFSIANDQASLEVKAFVVDKTLYILTMIAKTEIHNADEFKFFVNSFELAPKTEKMLNPEATFPLQK